MKFFVDETRLQVLDANVDFVCVERGRKETNDAPDDWAVCECIESIGEALEYHEFLPAAVAAGIKTAKDKGLPFVLTDVEVADELMQILADIANLTVVVGVEGGNINGVNGRLPGRVIIYDHDDEDDSAVHTICTTDHTFFHHALAISNRPRYNEEYEHNQFLPYKEDAVVQFWVHGVPMVLPAEVVKLYNERNLPDSMDLFRTMLNEGKNFTLKEPKE